MARSGLGSSSPGAPAPRDTRRCGNRAVKLVGIFTTLVVISSCTLLGEWPYPRPGNHPDAVLVVPNPDETPPEYFDTSAEAINDAGRIIGFSGSERPYPRTDITPPTFPVRGFAIDSDGGDYVELVATDAIATWPLAINNDGLVVGAYLIDTDESYALRAFSISDDGSNFVSLHNEGSFFTVATHVNDDGVVFGYTMDEEKRATPVRFGTADSAPVALSPSGYTDGWVQAVSTEYAIFNATSSGGDEFELLLYEIAAGSSETLVIPGVDGDTAEVEAIDEEGRIAGWYFVFEGENPGDTAFVYELGSDEARIYDEIIERDGSTYVDHRFTGFTPEGTIVGISYRVNDVYVLPQPRAARWSWDFSQFADITPPNDEAYGELFAVNDSGVAVGYAGFPYGSAFGRFLGVTNKAIVLDVE